MCQNITNIKHFDYKEWWDAQSIISKINLTKRGQRPKFKTDIKALLATLEEWTIYEIDIAYRLTNPIHKAFLFTGYSNGSYTQVYINTYGRRMDIHDIHNAYYLAIVREVASIKA